MARTGMVRLGSFLLVLALATTPSRGALIRHEFSAMSLSDAGPTAWWEVAHDAVAPSVDAVGEFPGWPGLDAAPGGGSRPPALFGPIHRAWVVDDRADFESFPMAAAREDARPVAGEADEPPAEPPLALAALAGVAAWTFCRRCTRRRPTPPPRTRTAPDRATGTAIVPAGRPPSALQLPAPRPRRPEDVAVAARPRALPARFVEVSATTLPARRMGVAAVDVRRRGNFRRLPA